MSAIETTISPVPSLTNHRRARALSRWVSGGLISGGVLIVVLCLVAITGPLSGQTLSFSDQTTPAGIQNIWLPGFFNHFNYSGGGACGDFNNDGFQDVFIPGDGMNGQPDRLFVNNGDGTFTNQAASWGLTVSHMGKGPSVADFNNDGWLDIFCTSAGPYNAQAPGHHKLYRNNGNNTFTNVASAAGVSFTTTTTQDGFGSCWGDVDLDGDLDLFVSGTANNNVGSILFRNNGNETFTNVTTASGLMVGLPFTMHGFTPRLVDMDGDFYPELLLASDFGTSRYYRNNANGTFTDVSASSQTAQEENGMGQTVGDFNGDGLLDWYVTSIYQPTINWTGNKLYINQGNHLYQEISVAAGVYDGGYGWGAVAVDFDHDGQVDILETNGGSNSTGTFGNEQSYLWLNNGNGTFTESAFATGLIHTIQGRGLVNLDIDNDGDQDVIVFAYNGPLVMFRNDLSGPNAHYLRVFLDTQSNVAVPPNGFGAKVRITAGGQQQFWFVHGGDNFLSKSEFSAHFGIGSATVVDEVLVMWPDGTTSTQTAVAADQTMTITYGISGPSFQRGDVNGDTMLDIGDSIALLAELFQGAGAVTCQSAADANSDGVLDISDPIFLLSYTFSMGTAPAAPFPDCGAEPSPLPCATGC